MISVVCPIFNEKDYIVQLTDFLRNSYPEGKEIFFIDGGSTDGTIELINAQNWNNQKIAVLTNTKQTVPFALNLAIPKCTRDIIVRLDAHTKYDLGYFKVILDTFQKIEADIVGGPTRTGFRAPFQEAVAFALNTKFGMGNSSVHDVEFEGYTDSVTFGAWRKSIFNTTGLFDTSLKRNQDDEFHYRARSLGFKIYQNPEIKLFYYPRNTWRGLLKQYFQYGLYKPLVLKKVSAEIKFRHLIPAAFVIYLISLPLLTFLMGWIYLLPLVSYLLIDFFYSFSGNKTWKAKFYCLLVYPTIHIAYGGGFLFGIGKL